MKIKDTESVTHARSEVTRFDEVVFEGTPYQRVETTTTVTSPNGTKTTKKLSWRLVLPKPKEHRHRTLQPLSAKEAKVIGLEVAFFKVSK